MIITGFENLSGSFVEDHLTGDDGNNVLAGNAANDVLVGGEGNDTLLGDGQFSIVSQTAIGSITLFEDLTAIFAGPSPGNDVLDGGEGHDRLVGVMATTCLPAAEVTTRSLWVPRPMMTGLPTSKKRTSSI